MSARLQELGLAAHKWSSEKRPRQKTIALNRLLAIARQFETFVPRSVVRPQWWYDESQGLRRRVRDEMDRAGLSARRAALSIGTSHQTLTRWLRAERSHLDVAAERWLAARSRDETESHLA